MCGVHACVYAGNQSQIQKIENSPKSTPISIMNVIICITVLVTTIIAVEIHLVTNSSTLCLDLRTSVEIIIVRVITLTCGNGNGQ